MPDARPVIGLTSSADADRFFLNRSYADSVIKAGGTPIVLPCEPLCAPQFIKLCDAIVFTGGADPIMEHWGIPTHPRAKTVDPKRQEFELALLSALDANVDKPVLGICLGMQMMGLHAGGCLDQHLPDHLPTASMHSDGYVHEIAGEIGQGPVHSHHRQALTSSGSMRVIATADDGVIEAITRDDRPFYLGVQWHPERTADESLGAGIFRKLVTAAKTAR
jgi:putative glutamine amidotransferase